ncbi:hypothetical protein BC938DRAFT_479368 [Jimgerdemannia flammicorona]|uniref:Alpha/Beta hydrolase protein n=1 Tax=Jimgerdemannia flammicorona TaxID=994334 RepID=A0A433QL19_9FUNG|nr:hypothetical protein BC938DRAFT_479368 [Jimgerdemannia flammicorona]
MASSQQPRYLKYAPLSLDEISQISKTELLVAGIRLNVFALDQWKSNSAKRTVSVLFMLHGRRGTADTIDSLCYRLASLNNSASKSKYRDDCNYNHLIVISFDHVNHGTRLVNEKANLTWAENNTTHAMDMWSTQHGTARDVSNLIDVLPAYLFPNQDMDIVTKWGVCGISLGGHSAFLALAADSRITVGIPIIGSASYTTLITHRAKTSNIPLASPYLPTHFLATLSNLDAAVQPASRFRGKRILVLNGGNDNLVPAAHNERFLQGLREEGFTDDIVRVRVVEGAGHEVVEEMVEELEIWVGKWLVESWDGKGRSDSGTLAAKL